MYQRDPEGRLLVPVRRIKAEDDVVDKAILALLMEGRTAKEAAIALGMSPRTVEHRIQRMKERHEARNVTHLVARILSAHPARPSEDPS